MTAEEIFAGVFPVVEGLIKSVDASAGTLSVQDTISKKAVLLKINTDSQLHKIPAEMAQRFAMRLKATLPPGTPGAAPASSAGSTPPTGANGQAGAPSGGMGQGGGGVGGARPGGGGGFDFQQLRTNPRLLDLLGRRCQPSHDPGHPLQESSTVIKLFSGVEPILQAAPSGSQAMMLAPWSLGGAPGGDASQ